MATLDGAATAWFSRHLVTLEMTYTVKHQEKAHEEARSYYTGFLLCEKGATVWVTAGHCMDEIDKDILGHPEHYADAKFRFVDTLHSEAVSTLPIPFDYEAEKIKGHLVHADGNGVEIGWDFGVVFLQTHYSRLLAANNIKPVEDANWINIPSTFDYYVMLGLPGERVKQLERGVYSARPAMFSITRLEERPACFAEQTDTMIYAEIDPDSEVENIRGMSGGPILGMRVDKETQAVSYWVLGVQSKRKQGRIIAASPLSELRDLLTGVIDLMFGPAEIGGDRVSD